MSRICVKGLPKHVDETKFKQYFSKFGNVTDCKIIKTKEGTSRLFGFIGFSSESEANKSLIYNGSYFDTSKISVELAYTTQQTSDTTVHRPWSKYSQGSSANNRKLRREKEEDEAQFEKTSASQAKRKDADRDQEEDEDDQDSEFKEFKGLMKSRVNRKLWSNMDDDAVQGETDGGAAASTTTTVKKRKIEHNYKNNKDLVLFDDDGGEKEMSEDEQYEDMPNNNNNNSDSDKEEEKEKELVDDSKSKELANNSALSDLDWLKSKVSSKVDVDDEDSEEEDKDDEDDEDDSEVNNNSDSDEEDEDEDKDEKEEDEDEDKDEDEEEEKEKDKKQPIVRTFSTDYEVEDIGESGRIFIRNLAYTVTEDDLKTFFEAYGKLSDIYIPIDKESKKSKGIAFVLFMIPENAMRAANELDGKVLQGRIVHILPAKGAPTKELAGRRVEEASSSFKLQKERELKTAAGNSYNWNSLFMRSDAIIGSLAERYKLSHGQVIDPNSSDLAVRMTLMETHIINETKKFLEQEGVVIDKIGGKGIDRSNSVILIKNIPHKTTLGEIEEMFGRYGELARALLTPARTLALVEFYQVNEAKAAFRGLAYSKFHTVPLFLEWAPVGLFKTAALTKEEKNAMEKKSREQEIAANSTSAAPTVNEGSSTATPAPSSAGHFVYIKNLSFDTREESLRDRFNKLRDFMTVNISTRMDPVRGRLSCGYGFAQFATKQGAYECIKKWNGAVLDGHELSIKMSDPRQTKAAEQQPLTSGMVKKEEKIAKEEAKQATNPGMVSTKISIKNIAFECQIHEIRKLFATYGELKTVRMPQKPAGGHRGFGFVEYLTEQEAKNAMDALQNSHLYGRHLILSFAEQDKNIEQLRQKASKDFSKTYQ